MPIPLISGGEIQIGETVIVFEDERLRARKNATLIADNTAALDPSMTIALSPRKNPTAEILDSQFSLDAQPSFSALISKVGVALLSSSGLDETLNQVASLVFEAVPAERCVIMLRDEDDPEDGMKIAVARRARQRRANRRSPHQPHGDGRSDEKRQIRFDCRRAARPAIMPARRWRCSEFARFWPCR